MHRMIDPNAKSPTEKKLKLVKAKITRVVTEIAIVKLDRDGNIEEVYEVLDELGYDDCQIVSILEGMRFYN